MPIIFTIKIRKLSITTYIFLKRHWLINPPTEVVMHEILAHILKEQIKHSKIIYSFPQPTFIWGAHTVLDTGGAGMDKTLYAWNWQLSREDETEQAVSLCWACQVATVELGWRPWAWPEEGTVTTSLRMWRTSRSLDKRCACVYVCMCVRVYVCEFWMCVFVYMCEYICECVVTCVQVCVYVRVLMGHWDSSPGVNLGSNWALHPVSGCCLGHWGAEIRHRPCPWGAPRTAPLSYLS